MGFITSNSHLLFKTLIYSIFLSSINCRVLNQIGRYYIEPAGVPGAENSAIDYENDLIFVADGYHHSVNSFHFSVDENVTIAEIEQSVNIVLAPAFERLGHEAISIADVTCVAMLNKTNMPFILATIVPVNHSYFNGWLAFVDPSNQSVSHLMEMPDCYLPDHVTSTYDGDIILVSCEAEPSENGDEHPANNPPGSVGYIDVSSDNMKEWEYTNIDFTEFDEGGDKEHLLPDDIYLPLPLNVTKFSLSAEPEHIVVDFDDKYAYVCLQESNAVAILDIANKEIINIFGLNYTYFGSNGGLDPSDKDGGINITEYDNLYGMRQPDDIDYFEIDGRKFIFTANEGDSKDFDEIRVKKLTLSDSTFGNDTDILKKDELLGRLQVSKLIGNQTIDGENVYHELYTFSSRDFTVYEVLTNNDGVPDNISLHFSSMNDFEEITAKMFPYAFNSDYSGRTFDHRSDAKGPEPEGLTIGECENGRLYVFICFERIGGIIAYDFTDIDNITFVDYTNNRNFSVTFDEDHERPPESAGDIGPEQMRWIPSEYYGEPLLVVSNPQSASVTMYRIDCGEMPITPTTMKPDAGGDGEKSSSLSTLEIVAIAIGAFAVVSIIALVIFIICRKRNKENDLYKYNSMNAGGTFTAGKTSGHYFELENN